MKIKNIEFINHKVFKNHKVIFGDTDIPDISFLVGNNGSGKTQILDTIYNLFTEPFAINPGSDFEIKIHILLSNTEQSELSLASSEIIYNAGRKNGGNFHQVNLLTGEGVPVNIQEFSKVVYSTVEVNFAEPSITSVTSKNTDELLKPKEKSVNLSTEIPQLLIDISSLDDAERGAWYASNINRKVTVPPRIGNRLDRFTQAFHKIYGGSKTFARIENISGSKRIVFLDHNSEEVSLNELSTGEKQIIYRIGYILKNLGNIHGGIVLIDEPEISLHPTWQLKLKDFLLEVFKDYDIQIIIATHSPYIFQNLQDSAEACIKLDRSKEESGKIAMIFPRVPYTPSINLINYLAYEIFNELLHI